MLQERTFIYNYYLRHPDSDIHKNLSPCQPPTLPMFDGPTEVKYIELSKKQPVTLVANPKNGWGGGGGVGGWWWGGHKITARSGSATAGSPQTNIFMKYDYS